jgi:hypothetical protein
MIRLSKEVMLIIGPGVAYEFDERTKTVTKKHTFTCSRGSKNLFCDPENVGTIYAMMWLKSNLYWANVHRNDGTFKNLILQNNQVIASATDKSGRSSQAITLYNTDPNGMAYGYDFLTDGRAMPFAIKLSASASQDVKINVRESEVSEKHPGLDNKVFWGCPQSFCRNTNFDAGMTVGDSLILFRGNFYWELTIPSYGLPFKTPTVETARQLTIRDIPYVDAATELSHGKGYLLFKDSQVYLIKSLSDTEAAKTWNLEEFMFGDSKNRGFDYINSAWFNHDSSILFLFKDDQYYQMKEEEDNFRLMGGDTGRKIIGDFKIFSRDLDAAFSLQGSVIFVKSNWFYDLPEKDWKQPSAGYGASLSLGSEKLSIGLFDTKESCRMKDQDFRILQNKMESDFGLIDAHEEGRFIKNSRRQKAEHVRTADANELLGKNATHREDNDAPERHDGQGGNSNGIESTNSFVTSDPDATTPAWVWPTVLVVLLVTISIVIILGVIYSRDRKKRASQEVPALETPTDPVKG